ncbi:hypothetical protein phytr_9700 [Candidatus Phycorickettsia trachydisci]|uniref:Uncharacterized protein n=1 Tax=Candidatus Phycorickettsia trachydisci TaxID=2115978 RepID=A0A2P1P9E7_9RICK|nr:hypothetical protein [Candidatus Phycorickettsia trachydisci]AVP87898.1 hypothetical protein phytr_9700 [Candidatus Phycorickettsia trachydisci]
MFSQIAWRTFRFNNKLFIPLGYLNLLNQFSPKDSLIDRYTKNFNKAFISYAFVDGMLKFVTKGLETAFGSQLHYGYYEMLSVMKTGVLLASLFDISTQKEILSAFITEGNTADLGKIDAAKNPQGEGACISENIEPVISGDNLDLTEAAYLNS